MALTERTILMPGMSASPTRRAFVAVDLGPEADPIALTPEVLDGERARLGCSLQADGTWKLSWKYRKEYLRDFQAQQGQPVFEPAWLDALAPALRNPLYCMDLDESGQLTRRDHGRLRVWIEPSHQPLDIPRGAASVLCGFGIGMDVSEGVGDSDSTIEVFLGYNFEQAAELADNRITPTDLGRFAAAVGRWYNEAAICCVRKMHGLTALRALADECHYRCLWHHKLADRIYESRAESLGWARGEASDPLLFGRWVDAVQYGQATLHSLACHQQHQAYIYDERGRITHQKLAHLSPEVRQKHGDMVIGCALARVACSDLPRFKAVIETPKSGIQRELERRQQKRNGVWR